MGTGVDQLAIELAELIMHVTDMQNPPATTHDDNCIFQEQIRTTILKILGSKLDSILSLLTSVYYSLLISLHDVLIIIEN